jgi:DNA-binding cell septation regulator SpoVG
MQIFADVRLVNKSDSKIRAHATATTSFGADGQIVMEGFSIFHEDGKTPWVAPPARKGERRYFPTITLAGKIRTLIEEAILTEYARQVPMNK